MSPVRGGTWTKLAFTPRPGTISPRQFGPTIRVPKGRAASSSRFRSSRPWAVPSPSPPSPNPAVMTTMPRVPRRPSWSTRAGTVSGGVAITARSGVTGRSATSL